MASTSGKLIPYCSTCLEPFQSQSLFDAHRVGPFHPEGARRCLTPAEMEAKGWRFDARAWTWRGPANEKWEERRKKLREEQNHEK